MAGRWFSWGCYPSFKLILHMMTTRRKFLQVAGTAAASSLAFPAILRAQNPGRRLNIAAIGGGGGKGEAT